MTLNKWIAGILVGSFVVANTASATTYKCDVRLNGHNGGISPVVVFLINDDETEAMVYDALIKETYDKPIEAKIVVANSKRYTLKWSVAVKSDSSGQPLPRIDYRATYLKRNHRISVTGFPAGYDNRFEGTGKYAVTK